MSFQPVDQYTLRCDHCGACFCAQTWPYRPIVGLKPSLLREALENGWQIDGATAYCPQHWHATCVECGVHTIASRNRLKRAGWLPAVETTDGWSASGGAPAGDRLLCPEHAANHARPPMSPPA